MEGRSDAAERDLLWTGVIIEVAAVGSLFCAKLCVESSKQ